MFLPPWRKSNNVKKGRKTATRTPPSGPRLGVEQLEDRTLCSATQVVQLNQQALGSFPVPVLASGGKVFFQADNGVDGSQLWATTGAGAAELTALHNGGTYGHTAVNGRDVFVGFSFDAANTYHEALYGSDGTAGGTALLLDLNSATFTGAPVTLGNNAYVAVQPVAGSHTPVVLYRTDGTVAGTAPVWDLGADSSAFGSLTAANGKLYLAAHTATGYGLYASDGNGAAPSLVLSAAAPVQGLQALGGRLYCYTQVLDSAAGLWDFNVYASDTTGTQAVLVKTVTAPSNLSNFNLTLQAGAGSEVFFTFQSNYSGPTTYGQTVDLYRTDGTAANTALVQSFGAQGYGGATGSGTPASYANLALLTSAGGSAYFTVQTHDYFGANATVALYRADAASAGAVKLLDLAPRSGNPAYAGTAADGAVLFTADDGSHGGELWRTDGTALGTTLVKDINPGAAGSNPSGFTALGVVTYFTADDGSHGGELWRTDGTAQGTSLVKDVNPGTASSFPANLTAFAGRLYFTASDPTAGNELWASDGTAAGTQRVADINSGVADSGPANLLAAPDALYFSADDGTHGNELWRWTNPVATSSATATAVSASNSSPVYGSAVTFTAQVSAAVGTPTGAVQFQVDGVGVGAPVALVNGQATSAAVALGAGKHTVTAVYSADSALFLGSSGNLTGGLTVAQAATATTVTSSAAQSVFGQVVTFTATVNVNSPGAGIPTGTVTFKDGNTVLGTGVVTVVNGVAQATFSTSGLSVAGHPITAVYGGDGNFLTSNAGLNQQVSRASIGIAVASSADPAVFSQVVTFTATLSVVAPGSSAAGNPKGTVKFYADGTLLGTGTLSTVNGVTTASFSTSTLATGTHNIKVVYGGDGNFLAGTSAVLKEQVHAITASNLAKLVKSLQAANPGQPVALSFQSASLADAQALAAAINALPKQTTPVTFNMTMAQGNHRSLHLAPSKGVTVVVTDKNGTTTIQG